MATSTIGKLILAFSISSALAGILLLNISWVIMSLALVSFFIFANSRFGLELKRTDLLIEREILDEMVFAGEPASIKIKILNKGRSAVHGMLEDMIPKGCKLASGSNKIKGPILPRSIYTMTYSLIPEKRGFLIIESMKIARVDDYGLLSEDQIINIRTALKVHTRKKGFDIARRIAGKEHLEYSGIARNLSLILREYEFDGIRDYLPGDNARDIYWKHYTRLGELMTKTYKKEGALQTMIFLDCSRSLRISGKGLSKIDHAIDLSMQLSNVLISSFHPTGMTIFDEISVLKEIPPAFGKHQFEKIVRLLRETPTSLESVHNRDVLGPRNLVPAITKDNDEKKDSDSGEFFLAKLGEMNPGAKSRKSGIGLDGMIKNQIARGKGQKHLFIIITDLISSGDSVIAGAKMCQITGNRMIIIRTYNDWYRGTRGRIDIPESERLYENISNNLAIEGALRRIGAGYIGIGPADSVFGIVRAIRRGRV